MPEDEPCAITALIEFLYTCDYHLDASASGTPLLTHAKVYTIADKYCLPLLQHLATTKFTSAASAALGVSPSSHNSSASLKTNDTAKLDFLSAVEYLYTAPPTPELDIDEADADSRNLQYEAVSLARQYSAALFNRSSVAADVYDRARSLLREYPDFAIDMALSSSYGVVPATKGITFNVNSNAQAGNGAWHSYRVDGDRAR